MTLTKDHIGGLIFLCFSVAYGYYANQIPLFPGDEYEPFHAKSMPTMLAGLGIALSLLQLVAAHRKTKLPLQTCCLWLGWISKSSASC